MFRRSPPHPCRCLPRPTQGMPERCFVGDQRWSGEHPAGNNNCVDVNTFTWHHAQRMQMYGMYLASLAGEGASMCSYTQRSYGRHVKKFGGDRLGGFRETTAAGDDDNGDGERAALAQLAQRSQDSDWVSGGHLAKVLKCSANGGSDTASLEHDRHLGGLNNSTNNIDRNNNSNSDESSAGSLDGDTQDSSRLLGRGGRVGSWHQASAAPASRLAPCSDLASSSASAIVALAARMGGGEEPGGVRGGRCVLVENIAEIGIYLEPPKQSLCLQDHSKLRQNADGRAQ